MTGLRPVSSPLTVMQCTQCMFGGLQQDRVTGMWADPSQKESYPNHVLLPTCASTFKVGEQQLIDSSGGMQSYKGISADKYVVNNSDKCWGACLLKISRLVIAQADDEQNGPVPSSQGGSKFRTPNSRNRSSVQCRMATCLILLSCGLHSRTGPLQAPRKKCWCLVTWPETARMRRRASPR